MMFCTSCGNELPDASGRCLKCGAYQGQAGSAAAIPSPNPDNYLVAAILLCLCWCLPFGLVSLVYAGKGSGLKEAGDMVRAADYGSKARMWAWVGFGAGALIWVGYALIVMIGVMSDVAS